MLQHPVKRYARHDGDGRIQDIGEDACQRIGDDQMGVAHQVGDDPTSRAGTLKVIFIGNGKFTFEQGDSLR